MVVPRDGSNTVVGVAISPAFTIASWTIPDLPPRLEPTPPGGFSFVECRPETHGSHEAKRNPWVVSRHHGTPNDEEPEDIASDTERQWGQTWMQL
jgi:hypothetical protein